MAGFKKKRPISGQSLGERLRKLRLEQNRTLEEVEAQTKVQIKYLEILENGEYHRLPGDIYARVWIKEYARYLGVPEQELLAEYKLEKKISENINELDRLNNRPKVSRDNVILRPRSIKLIIIGLVITAVLGYLIGELVNIIAPPVINISQPSNNFITTGSQIKIIGQTVPEAELIINGERVLTDGAGGFEQTVNLTTGLNKFRISAKKKHSRTNYLEWDILRQ